jgi:hypothetical protein
MEAEEGREAANRVCKARVGRILKPREVNISNTPDYQKR